MFGTVYCRCCQQYTSRSTQTYPLQKIQAGKDNSLLTRKMSVFFGLPFQPNSVSSEEKASRVLGVVFFTFVTCWAPFFLLNFVIVSCSENWSPPIFLIDLALWLGYTSSTLNPIIYTIFNIKFRRSFVKLLLCRGRIESNTHTELTEI